MKTKYAKEKSEYSHCLHNFINIKLKPKERFENFRRMEEIQELLKKDDDAIQIIVTTVNTSPFIEGKQIAPPMSMENIKNG